LRIDGVRAYELARAGKEFPRELALRNVKVSELEMIEWIVENSFPPPKEEASQDEQDLEKRVLGTTSETQPEENESALKAETKDEEEGSGEEKEEDLKKPGPACRLRMTVSGGFYVRSLCYDLGLKMNSGAYMADLVRTRQGDFSFDEAVPWEDFTQGGPWEDKVVSILKNPPKRFKEPEGFEKSVEKSDEGVKKEVD
jgi:tRNA pseudouridine55 synthase